jgi:hypothetical protein
VCNFQKLKKCNLTENLYLVGFHFKADSLSFYQRTIPSFNLTFYIQTKLKI